MHWEMLTTIKLVNTSISSQNYCFCVCVVRTLKIYSVGNRLTDTENRLMVAKAGGMREGWIESLGLADANYYM